MNVKLTYPPSQTVRKFRSSVIQQGKCKNVTQEVTEIAPPLDCLAGDRMILFLKNPAVVADGSGVVVGSITTRNYVNGNYEYWVQVADSLFVGNVTLDQCDTIKACCFDCVAEYLCRMMAYPNCPAIKDCVGSGMSEALGLHYDALSKIFNVAISQGAGNNLTQLADGLYVTTTEQSQIDATLKRDGGGILGVADNAMPVAGHASTFGIDADGSGIRIPEVSAIAGMTGASSSSLAAMTPETYELLDYDDLQFDPLGMITPGVDWHLVVPYTGRYLMNLAALFDNAAWGGFGPSQYAALTLAYSIDGAAQIELSSREIWARDQVQLGHPQVEGTVLLNLTSGQVLRTYVKHSDNNQPNDTHHVVAQPQTRFSIHRVL
jgi:hypothetical protein